MIVNADELKLFRTIYETESLSEAAARLQLSLSKASRQLASLRKTFGDKLFVRCDHRMCPTLRARSLLPKVDALLSGFEALECPGVFSVEQLRHVFRIAGLDNALLSYFGPVLGALGRHAPGVRLNFHSISSNFYAELHQGRIDLAIYATQESFPTFRRLAICEDAYVYVARGTSELARRVLSGQVLTEREVRARQSVQIALPKASADDCGLIPVIESLDASGQASPVLSAPTSSRCPSSSARRPRLASRFRPRTRSAARRTSAFSDAPRRARSSRPRSSGRTVSTAIPRTSG